MVCIVLGCAESHNKPRVHQTMSEHEMPGSGWYSNETATFGDRLAAAREALGMSEKDLARRLGIALKTLQSWEADTSEPRANKLQMLAGLLNVSIKWLLTGEGEGVAAPGEAVTTDVAALLAELRQLRGEAMATADRLGVIEKRLKLALAE